MKLMIREILVFVNSIEFMNLSLESLANKL